MILRIKKNGILNKNLIGTVLVLVFLFFDANAWATQELPIELPKLEGSMSFDFEISRLNNQAINKYQHGQFADAIEYFKKALALAQNLRDPSKGILYFNLSLSLHKSENHEEAARQFYSAQRFARGNSKILDSELLKSHKCGFNPSVSCEKKMPLNMNIEGSD